MDNSEIVKLLYDFDNQVTPPDGIRVDVDSHSTAIHCSIYLTMEGEKDLLVWYKTNWRSSNYEFNEEGKIKGYQPGCDFIKPALDTYFDDVAIALADHNARTEAEREIRVNANETSRDNLVEKHKAQYLERLH